MGEIIAFPGRSGGGCSRWQVPRAAITLSLRPACAALAHALDGHSTMARRGSRDGTLA